MQNCIRCNTGMVRTHHEEVESIGDCILITEVYIAECPLCSLMTKTRIPVLPGEERIGIST